MVAGLKRHFGSDGEAPGSSPGQALEKAVGKADETLGGAVRALREKKGCTIVEAAAKMSGPGSRDDSTWGQIERGEIKQPPDEVLAEIARMLGGSARTLRRLRDAGTGKVKKELPDEEAVEPVEKGFKEGTVEKTAKTWELLANAWIHAREYEKSESPLIEAARLSEDGGLYIRLAQVYIEREAWEDASDALVKAFEKGKLKDPGRAHHLHGIVYHNMNQPQKARRAFERAAKFCKTRRWLEFIE